MEDTKDTKASCDFFSHGAQTSLYPSLQFEIDQNIENEEDNLKSRKISRCGIFVKTLKLMSASAVITVISDLLLFVCGLALVVGGCFIQDQTSVLYTMLISYRNKFRAVGQTCVVIGVIYATLITPAGIFSVIKRKRKLLKAHNIWLILNLAAEGIILYLLWIHLHKNERRSLQEFRSQIAQHHIACAGLTMESCCCIAGRNGEFVCFDYHTKYVMPTKFIDLKHHIQSREEYFEDCSNKNVLYFQLQYWIKWGYFFVIIFMIIQAIALFSGWVGPRFKPIYYSPEELADFEPTTVEVEREQEIKKMDIN